MKPFAVVDDIRRRSAEAAIAQSGLNHEGLTQEIRRLLVEGEPSVEAIVQEPVLEGAYPFQVAPVSFGQLAGKLLSPELVDVLDGGTDARKRNYVFPRAMHPYKHQLASWQTLLAEQPSSVVVTSGTGSGKTECFLVPILETLARREGEGAIEGVEALMLYPLNALIESQKDRLSEWTAPFNGKIRYCLYNGNLPEDDRDAKGRAAPWEVHDRKGLRNSPPPLLVTNVTMLEYLLVRPADQPILAKSKGKLKWIILDEAHTLVGAAAAEIALLLRRVLMAFGVKPEDVRFVATSATIGEGEKVKLALQKFLADVAGLRDDQVIVIEGHRRAPDLTRARPKSGGQQLSSLDDFALFDELAGNTSVRSLVQDLFCGPVTAQHFRAVADELAISPSELVECLSRATSRGANGALGDRLAPLRVHSFQRAMPGLWSCINPQCADSPAAWPFGRVLTEMVEQCPSCQSVVLEIQSCSLCGEAILHGLERGDRLGLRHALPPDDEFREELDREQGSELDESSGEEEVGATAAISMPSLSIDRYFPAKSAAGRPMLVEARSGQIRGQQTPDTVQLAYQDPAPGADCPCCGGKSREGSALRSLRFGAPFFLGNATPILLDAVEPESKTDEPLPSQGRRLLSFTDSRQGTARLSAKLQSEAERNFIRSFVYHTVQSEGATGAQLTDEDDVLRRIAALEQALSAGPNDIFEALMSEQKEKLKEARGGQEKGIEWDHLRSRLAERLEVTSWIREVWEERDERFAEPSKLAEFLLLREFARRPTRANSVETLGLAALRCDHIEKLGEAALPEPFRRRSKSVEDWRSYLYAVLTHMVRANSAIHVHDWMQNWIMPKTFPRFYRPAGSDVKGLPRALAWPAAGPSSRGRAVLLLKEGLQLNLDDRGDREDLDICLRSAWDKLATPMVWSGSAERAFDFGKFRVTPLVNAFYCPVTHRILDVAPFGLTAYGLGRSQRPPDAAQPITLPKLPVSVFDAEEQPATRALIQEWLVTDASVNELRERGAWRDLNDRVALFANYARSAEHSAQQDTARLRAYEKDFKAGRINVLNCSTTMEMGVDIGSVSTVMMTNVPPSIANYKQRVGRAGRRGQPVSLAFTFAKDRPLDRAAYRDPAKFLRRSIAAPRVTLTSRPIVQRHVNAYLLAAFLRITGGNLLALEIGSFLGCPSDPEVERLPKDTWPVAGFLDWIGRASTWAEHGPSLLALTRGSVLANDRTVVDASAEAMEALLQAFQTEWQLLRQQATGEDTRQGARTGARLQLHRLCKEFLPSALADRGFLPGHGFPTDVVSFLPHQQPKSTDAGGQGENPYSRRGGPQRQLEIAIRDYAPGCEVVLDGLVHKSAGVTLNWQRPAGEDGVRAVQSLRHHWTCTNCGSAGSVAGDRPERCPACGEPIYQATRFLRPAGFSVDTGEKAHAEVEAVTYVPPEEAHVSTGLARWTPLPLPEAGRLRSSREGHVFHASQGALKNGYAICLQCGKAAAEHASADVNPPLPGELLGHKTLRPVRGGKSTCAGNIQPFSIQRHLALGYEFTTDVFELQPSQDPGKATANALAIAMREGLALVLGVEPSDIGFSVRVTFNAFEGKTRSLFLFDKASGGAGFAASAEHHFSEMMQRAWSILNCATPGCETGCPACVLVSDAPDEPDSLDRTAAKAFLQTHLLFSETVPEDDQIGPDTKFSTVPIDDLDRLLTADGTASLTLFTSEIPDPVGLNQLKLGPALENWAFRGRSLRLVLPASMRRGIAPAAVLALRDIAARYKLELFTGQAPTFPNGASALAVVEGAQAHVLASRDQKAAVLGENWGRSDRHPIVRAALKIGLEITGLPSEVLEPPPGAQYREITRDLDGSAHDFGTRAAKTIEASLKKAGSWHDSPIVGLTYQDGYVRSPLVAWLLVSTAAALAKRSGGEPARLLIKTPPLNRRSDLPPRFANHDWEEERTRASVLQQLGTQLNIDVTLALAAVPHGRYLTVSFADGKKAQVVLDQGFGAWNFSSRVEHQFRDSPERQVSALLRWRQPIVRRGVGSTYIVVTQQ